MITLCAVLLALAMGFWIGRWIGNGEGYTQKMLHDEQQQKPLGKEE